MDPGRLYFDSSNCHGNMLFLGNSDYVFRGARSIMSMEEGTRKQSFFSVPEEVMFDEEYYDEQLPEKKRRLTPEQVHLLEKSFEAENKLEPERKTQLAKKLGLQPRQVAVWFQNRRARWKTKQLERDYDLLKTSYETLLSDYESTLKENEKLKSEVVSLTEKLEAKEAAIGPIPGHKSDSLPGDVTHVSALQFSVKVEDRLSSGSGGSAVVDEDGPQLLDSGDSYFANDDYTGCVAPVDGVQSEDVADVFVAAEQQHHGEGESLGFWIWP